MKALGLVVSDKKIIEKKLPCNLPMQPTGMV